MNEIDKMRKSELADMEKPEIQASFIHAKKLLAKMRTMTIYDEDFRQILEDWCRISLLLPSFVRLFIVTMAPVSNWENMYLSILIVLFLDGGYITIGAHTLIGPNVQLYTPHHPIDYIARRETKEYAYPITIGEDCWIGGGAIICPGVTYWKPMHYWSR